MLEKLRSLPELAALPLLIVIGLVFFSVTNPRSLPPVVLVLGFVILSGLLYCVVRLFARFMGLREKLQKGQYNAALVCVTLFPVMLLALQSIGQLTVRDTVTLAVLFLAGYVYVSRMSSS